MLWKGWKGEGVIGCGGEGGWEGLGRKSVMEGWRGEGAMEGLERGGCDGVWWRERVGEVGREECDGRGGEVRMRWEGWRDEGVMGGMER